MNDLAEIYKRMEYLRNKGMKMKEMADHTHMPASVLSSLYASVLPTFLKLIHKGESEDAALDYALSQVNNVSKKRLLNNLEEMKNQLMNLEPPIQTGAKPNPFLDMLTEEMHRSMLDVDNYSGIYLSYSISSASNALKIEPYLIAPSENNDYVKVTHRSAYNGTHYGMAIFNNSQSAYIQFNELDSPQLALFTIYLQLPMYCYPSLLKGLYLSLDYNRNPIARRILFVKQSDSVSADDCMEYNGEIVLPEKLTDEQKAYYEYTCQVNDYIKTCTVPSPQLNENDLVKEKKILEL